MNKPLIGLTGRSRRGRDMAGVPEPLHGCAINMYFADYARGVIEAGGLPVHVPMDVDPVALASRLDGLLITGGTDVDPARYGAEPHPELLQVEPDRDEIEFALLDSAIEKDVPVLGICRGLQVINIFDGGSVHQHVPPHWQKDKPPESIEHGVEFKDGSVLQRLYGPSLQVNTIHHQTVDRPGTHLTVTAIADDGEVEGLEHDGAPVVAVQWHPEMMTGRPDDPIFGWLVDEAAARMAS